MALPIERGIDDQQETSFSTTSIEPSSANTPPHNNANVTNAYTTNGQDKAVVNFEQTKTDVEQEGLLARATNDEIDAMNNNSVNQTQGTTVNTHKLLASKLKGIFTTINQRQMLDEYVRNLLCILTTSLASLHQKCAEVRNQVKKLNRFNMNLKKEMKNNQRPLKHKYDELFDEFNALKQETAQICQCIDGNGGNHQEDRDFIYSDGSTKTINSGLINSGWICYANAYLLVIASLPFLPTSLRTSSDSRMQHHGLYYAFATIISSLAGSSQIPINPMDLMTKFNFNTIHFSMENNV